MNVTRLWVFVLEAKPLFDSPEFQQFGGASVICWQMPGLAENQVHYASKFIRDAGWEVIRVEQTPALFSRDEVPEDTINRFDQALIDDEVYQFHTWPVGVTDATKHHRGIDPPAKLIQSLPKP